MVSRNASIARAPADAPEITLEAWLDLPAGDGEVVDARLVEEEVPDYVHELVVSWFIIELGRWSRGRGALVAGSGAKFRVGPLTGRMPDVTVFLSGSPRPPARGLVEVPPDLAVEVVSPTPRDARRDRVEKLAEYAAFGVRWYWIVDPDLRTFEVLELVDGRYAHTATADQGVVTDLPGFPNLALDLGALWAEVDGLPPGA